MSNFIGYFALGITSGLIYGLLALGLVLIYKGTRILNFAHPFLGLQAAYLCWWLTSKASFFPFSLMPFEADTKPRFAVAVLLTLVLTALNGYGLEHSIMRKLRGAPRLTNLVATIALGLGTVGGVLLLFGRTGDQADEAKFLPSFLSGEPFAVGSQFLDGADLQPLIVAPVIAAALALFFKRSRFGVAVRAAAENGDAARLLGISVDKVSQFTWIVGSVLAGLAGILVGSKAGTLDLGTLSTGFLVRALAAALVGGLTSLPGAMVGGLVIGIGEEMMKWLTGGKLGAPETLLFGIVIAVLVIRPQGLFGQREETEDKAAFVPTIRDLPARLRGTPYAKALRFGWVIPLLFVCTLSLVSGARTNGALTAIVVFAIVGVSLTILVGWSGQISLGHWGLVGVGAFSLANLHARVGVPYLLAIPMTVVVGMFVSLLIGLPALRIRGLYLGVATLAFNFACELLIFKSQLVGKGTSGIIVSAPKYGPFDLGSLTNRPLFFFSLLMLGLVLLFARNLMGTRTARGFFALRENEKAAATLGVGLTQYKLVSFVISGGIAALAGGLYATLLGRAEVTTWGTQVSLQLIAMVMIGGLGSLSGSIYGAFIVFGIPRLFEFENPWIIPITTGILLIVVITRLKGGVAGLVQSAREAIVTTLDDLERYRRDAPPADAPTVGTPAPIAGR